NKPGAWQISLDRMFRQLFCDTPSVSALDYHQISSGKLSHLGVFGWVLGYPGSVWECNCTCGTLASLVRQHMVGTLNGFLVPNCATGKQ
ncbi:hypothetical protein GOODEAATRI_020550, partial [Goodea atripinnis]